MQAYITKTSRFFPNQPVVNDEMESYLGMINNTPSRARRIILARNGIKTRYYALDKNGNETHTNVAMAAQAVRNLMGERLSDIDLLACGTASPEQLVPSHGVMVHGELPEAGNIEVVSFAGSCCTGVDALKYAMMSVMQGNAENAVVCASERISAWMRASYFLTETDLYEDVDTKPILAFEKEFLRWMLSDGALAVLVQPNPAEDRLSLRIDWIEKKSYANEVKTCMYAGGEKDENGDLHGWASFPETEWLKQSLFAVKQDTRILDKYIIELGGNYMKECLDKHHITSDEVDWFLPHLSSMYFANKTLEKIKAAGCFIPQERWFINLPEVGNIASASAFAMIDGLMESGKLQKGQKVLVMVPESARFSFTYCMLTVC